MYPDTTTAHNNKNLSRILVLILSIMLAVLLYLTISSYHHVQQSGTLTVDTPNDDSLITVSAVHKTAELIGYGSTRVRLQPGSYLVGVAREGRISSQVVVVSKGQTAVVHLSATSTPLLPTAADIDFVGTDALITKGLTTNQVEAIREAIFQFNKDTKVAVVQPDSVVSGPYDPGSDNPLITRNFVLTLDGQAYSATASWVELSSASLILRDSTGNVVFDSVNAHD